MPGRKSLRKVQMGLEAQGALGTRVPATMIWRGPAAGLDDTRETVNPEEQVGSFAGFDRTYYPKTGGMYSFPETEAVFEQIHYPFVGGGFGSPVGTLANTSVAVFRTPRPTNVAPGTVFSYSIETGDDAQAEYMTFGLCSKISIKGKAGEALKISSEWMGREVLPMPGGTFTPNVVLREVEEILTGAGSLFLDNVIGGTYFTTRVSNQILAVEINITPKWEPKYTMDGRLDFSFAVLTAVDVDGKITFEHEGAGTFEKAQWRARQTRRLAMAWTGGSIPGAGTVQNYLGGGTFCFKTFAFNTPIRWMKFDPIADQNGNDIIVGNFISRQNVTTNEAGTFYVAVGTANIGGTVLP